MESPSPDRPTLLVLGSYHMNNPGRDAFNLTADDVLAPERQTQIRDVVARLGAFHPTQVAIEQNGRLGDAWQRDYRAFRAGTFSLTRDERHQIGFRVAADAGVERITAVDWDWEDGNATGPDPEDPWAYAAARQPQLHRLIEEEGQRQIAEMARVLETGTVRDLLRWLNSPEQEAANHQSYLGLLALTGSPANPVGVAWLASWYRRNLLIFTNLVRLAPSPHDRVFAIYGAGHVPLLRQFAHLSGLFRVEETLDYL